MSVNTSSNDAITHIAASFLRRLAALLYDAFLLLAVLFLATALLLPFNAGEAVTAKLFLYPYYLLVSFLFYAWFWTHSGQTVGLKTWKSTLRSFDNQPITWKQALIRFLAALLSLSLLGLGFLWALVDKKGYSLHDYLSKTVITTQET